MCTRHPSILFLLCTTEVLMSSVLAPPLLSPSLSLNGIYPEKDYNSAMNNPQYSRLVQYIRRLEDYFFKTSISKVWSCGFRPMGLLSRFVVTAYWLLFSF